MADSLSFHFLFITIVITITIFNLPFLSSSLPTVSISHINSSQTLICALTKSPTQQQTSLNCTIPNSPIGIRLPFNDGNAYSFVGIVGGSQFLCAVSSPSSVSTKPTSFLVCWRFLSNGSWVYKRVYRGPPLKDIDSGDSHVCGIVSTTNRLRCWQWKQFDSISDSNSILSRSQFDSSVAVGENYVCGLSEFGQIKCVGSNCNSLNITNSSPVGNYSVISVGYNRVCAINLNGGLDCWGETIQKPNGVFKSVALGENRICAIRVNGTVICGGESDFHLPENLREVSFEGLQANHGIFCGILTSNYSLYCWGSEILTSNSIVFEDVVPGLCTISTCAGGTIPNYATFCSPGLRICEPCAYGRSLPEPLPSPVPSPLSLPPNPSSHWDTKMVAFVVVGSAGCLSLVIVLSFLVFRCCKSSGGSRVHDSGPMDDIQIASRAHSVPVLEKKFSQLISMRNRNQLEEFTLQSILEATDNFSDEHRIGNGSFGLVYRAVLVDGREVAVKRAELSCSGGGVSKRHEDTDTAFVNELESLSRVNHKHLVRLLGFCEENNELVLVYEYMENGSLQDHLHNSFSSHLMSWPARIKVALDAARGLEYLHVYVVPPIIHRDIKSSNILLDATWTGKVSDFGLSLIGPPDEESHLSLRAAGTVGYMDPEYYKFQQLTTKSDVYSFGIVLLELLSGHRAIHKNTNGEPRNVVDSVVPYIMHDEIHRILDPKVPPPTPFEIEAVKYMGYLAVDCVTLGGKDRPTMSELVTCLERALTACSATPLFSGGSADSLT